MEEDGVLNFVRVQLLKTELMGEIIRDIANHLVRCGGCCVVSIFLSSASITDTKIGVNNKTVLSGVKDDIEFLFITSDFELSDNKSAQVGLEWNRVVNLHLWMSHLQVVPSLESRVVLLSILEQQRVSVGGPLAHLGAWLRASSGESILEWLQSGLRE